MGKMYIPTMRVRALTEIQWRIIGNMRDGWTWDRARVTDENLRKRWMSWVLVSPDKVHVMAVHMRSIIPMIERGLIYRIDLVRNCKGFSLTDYGIACIDTRRKNKREDN